MGLTRLAIRRPLTVLMGILALVLMGGVAYTYLQVDRLPPVQIGVVSVSVGYPNASAENVERLIAEPLENAISGISGVDTITSTSNEGSANVTVQLVDGYDPNQADIDIQEAMGPVARQLPTGATTPVVRKFDPNASPILNLAFTGAPLDQLYDIANNQIQPALAAVPGVGQVNISGGLQREIQIQIDYAKLAAYGITTQQISTALTGANVSIPSGAIPVGGQNVNIVPQGLFQSIQDIQHVVITTSTTGAPITVGDVATVQDTTKTQYSLQRLNGQDAVGLSITANSDANTVQVSDAVQAELKKLQPLLPQGTTTTVVEDQSLFTRASLDSIQRDLAIAVILVAVVILVFLHDWKHTAIVLCAIPTSLISTFLVMYLLHFTLNTMSMMALALMIGILVDDSIVVLENIHRHLQLGESPWAAALNGRSEIGMAALAITMADVVVYTPIAFMSGSIGQLFRQYGLTVVAATIFSMLMSFTLTPMLASRWLRHTEGPGRFTRLKALGNAWDRGFARVGDFFAATVPWTLRMRWLVLLIGAAMVVASAALIPLKLLGMEYAPAEDDNTFEVNLQLPPGTALDPTNQAALEMENYIKQMPEVEYYFTTASVPGGSGGGFRGGSSSVNIQVQTVDKNQRKRSVFDLINALRAQARNIPGANFSGGVSSPLPGGGGGGGGSINVQLSGPDLNTVNQIASDVQTNLQQIPGVQDVRSSNLATLPELDIKLDTQRMAALGITNQTVDQALSAAIGGTTVTEFQPPGTQQEDITLMAPNTARYNTSTLSAIPVGTESGTTNVVTLGQIATITNGTGPVSIQRVNREVTVSMTATPVGRPLADVANDISSTLKNMAMPAGYGFALRGQVQIFNQAITALGAALVLSVILEYMLLVALYESWLFPLVRMLTVPLGMIGALLLLWLTGNTINIFSIIGMIMGEGLVAKSGILLVDYANTLRERGVGRMEALQEAVRVRLRPILMTSATMIFGMLALALKLEPGAETRAPMAIVVIGALLSSTVLTLVIVPALYTVMDDLQNKLFGRQRKPWETPEPVAAPQLADAVVAATNGNGEHPQPHAPGVPLNVHDYGDVYLVRAALPGIRQEDVDVSIEGHTLCIRGERRGASVGNGRVSTNGSGNGQVVLQEYDTGHWERSMVLPQEVESDQVTARYEDGILELRLPKAGPASRRHVPIDGPAPT
ncbi:MAG: efflux RND transporter permease subunit [Chloroflexi bacterium]|nr:efflux RND transporter permease subunit [Chloroflexota bacterium]